MVVNHWSSINCVFGNCVHVFIATLNSPNRPRSAHRVEKGARGQGESGFADVVGAGEGCWRSLI